MGFLLPYGTETKTDTKTEGHRDRQGQNIMPPLQHKLQRHNYFTIVIVYLLHVVLY